MLRLAGRLAVWWSSDVATAVRAHAYMLCADDVPSDRE